MCVCVYICKVYTQYYIYIHTHNIICLKKKPLALEHTPEKLVRDATEAQGILGTDAKAEKEAPQREPPGQENRKHAKTALKEREQPEHI